MASAKNSAGYDPRFVRNMIESALRIGLVLALLTVVYDIIRPFLTPILWGSIIGIAAFPLVKWLERFVGGRRGLAASLVTLFFVMALVVPTWVLMETSVGAIKTASASLESGSLHVPPPAQSVRDWPLVGERVYTVWNNSSKDLQAVVEANAPHLKEVAGNLLKRLGNSLVGILMFIVAIIIAGGFMAYAESCGAVARRIFIRIGGPDMGAEWAPLTVATVRNVLQGVVGVALIQTILISIGLFAAGVPGAAVLTVVILVLAIAQLPALILTIPIMIYVFSTADTTTAVIFTVYQLFAGASDNILKPMLMGRGLAIPMPVILIGAIGGMIMSGIIGLFAGAVILSIFYNLMLLWLAQQAHEEDAASQDASAL